MINYIRIARPDHWFKNVFMIPGMALALLFTNVHFDVTLLMRIIIGIFATCLIASANYTINELLDAPFDREHPVKKDRPAAAGLIKPKFAYLQYAILIIAGLALSYQINLYFFYANAFLLIMGFFYNVRPIRIKDIVYLDVISESINNPIRLVLGWFIISNTVLPPLSIIVAYWMIGAFFMATKRFGEIRFIADHDTIKIYRKSLSRYTESKLLISIIFYASLFSFTSAVFLIRYRFEFILLIPILAALISEYMRIGFLHDSPVQYPETLYKQKKLVMLCFILMIVFIILIFVQLPWLAQAFDPQYKIEIK